MTDLKRPGRWIRATVALALFAELTAPRLALAEEQEAKSRPLLVGLRLGAVAGYLDRDSATDAAGVFGPQAAFEIGGAITPRYATGIGFRGSWLFPTKLTFGQSVADNPQLLQGSIYWLEQFETSGGTGLRLTAGPLLSQLLIDGEAPVTEPLIGGEVGFEYRFSKFLLTNDWSHDFWGGLSFSAAFGHRPHDEVPNNDRELMGKLFLSISLETVPHVSDPNKPKASK